MAKTGYFDPSHFAVANMNGLSPQAREALQRVSLHPKAQRKLPKKLTSHDVINSVVSKGMDYTEVSLPIFAASKFGKYRRLDNTDLVAEYPMYTTAQDGTTVTPTDGVRSLSNVMSAIGAYVPQLQNFLAKSDPILLDMENEDLNKITILRTTYLGRHLQPPLAADASTRPFPPGFYEMLKRVIKRYASATNYKKTGIAAMLDGTDAKATALGAPSFTADDQLYENLRNITMADVPAPDFSKPASEYAARLQQWGGTMFADPTIAYASYMSFRQGATRKPIPAWYQTSSGFAADYELESYYSRQRGVWPAPFYVNVLATPLVLAMKDARRNILGLWHDPAHSARYVSKLQAQGKICYEMDYSNYDQTIINSLLVDTYYHLAAAGMAPWAAELMGMLTKTMGALMPSFTGQPSTASYFSSGVSLLSGLLTTSEIGTVISISLTLYALSKQRPELADAWFRGQFTVLVQSDDVLFTASTAIDELRFTDDLASMGIKAKLKRGSTFLKQFLPLGSISQATRPFSRNIQQTIGNEDSYAGKIDAILRLGLIARSQGLQSHPAFGKFWPDLLKIYEESFYYVKSSKTLSNWYKGDFVLSPSDLKAIMEYATSKAGIEQFTNLLERATYDPTAATVLAYLRGLGLNFDQLTTDQVTARRHYVENLMKPPTAASHASLLKICKWYGR